jgi:hypothetical protein
MANPCSITFYGLQDNAIPSCTQALLNFCETIEKVHNDSFKSAVMGQSFFSNEPKSSAGRDFKQINQTDIYVNVHGSADELIKRIKIVAPLFGYAVICEKIDDTYKIIVEKQD